MLYIVSYDLRTPGQDYPKLITTLKGMGGVKVLLSAWLVPSTKDATPLRQEIDQNGGLDSNDRLMVVELRNHAAWRNILAPDATVQQLFRDHART